MLVAAALPVLLAAVATGGPWRADSAAPEPPPETMAFQQLVLTQMAAMRGQIDSLEAGKLRSDERLAVLERKQTEEMMSEEEARLRRGSDRTVTPPPHESLAARVSELEAACMRKNNTRLMGDSEHGARRRVQRTGKLDACLR
jgi:hypothetical protein